MRGGEQVTSLDQLRQQMSMVTKFRQQHVGVLPKQYRFWGAEDLVLKHGKVYPRSQLYPPVARIPRACFAQAYRLAMRPRSKWVYVEGFAACSGSMGIAVNHAWVVRADDPTEAHDLAWENPDGVYIGIAFDVEFVRSTFKANRREYGVLDTWRLNYPLLTGKTRIEDVKWAG
jgi:hypothetical protein